MVAPGARSGRGLRLDGLEHFVGIATTICVEAAATLRGPESLWLVRVGIPRLDQEGADSLENPVERPIATPGRPVLDEPIKLPR